MKNRFNLPATPFGADSIQQTIQRALTSAGLDPSSRPLQDVTETIRRALASAGLASDGVSRESNVRPSAGQAPQAPGTFEAHEFSNHAGSRAYKLYVPARTPDGPRPMVVMLHGCTQAADDFAAGTRMNRLADQQGFLVVYPEQAAHVNPSKCWNWFQPQHQVRDAGEPALIAGIVGDVAQRHGADPRRIFVAGLSAGAAMAVVLGETYPELFAAVGAHSGLPYGSAHDTPSALVAMKGGRSGLPGLRSLPGGAPVPARKAVQPLPIIVFHGDRDHTVQQTNAAEIVEQARAAHLARSAEARLTPSTQSGAAPGGRRYSRTLHTDSTGQVQIESWTLHGAGHAWAGGDARGSYTDATGPDASAEMVRFFLAQPRAGSACAGAPNASFAAATGMNEADIMVLGAGPAGLAVSACLRREGLAHQVVEREAEVAAGWRRHYDRLHLHTAKHYSGLPLTPWPDDAPRYPSRAQVVDYLSRYAAVHAVAPRFGVEVHRVQRQGDRFAIDTSAGPLAPRFLVVATGCNGVAIQPELPGLAGFGGTVQHAQDYRNPARYIGRRTLVVGCGNSGAEIALDLAEQGVDVAMVVRGPVHVAPRDLLGLPSQLTSVMLAGLPARWRDALVAPVLRWAVGDLARWGIVRPTIGPYRTIESIGRLPILDVGTIAKIKAGEIRVLPAVVEVLKDRVRFADRATHPFEALVLATGYTPGLERLIAGFEAIADARGRPDRFGEESAIAGLFFIGFKNPPTGALREIALEAPRIAAAIKARVGA